MLSMTSLLVVLVCLILTCGGTFASSNNTTARTSPSLLLQLWDSTSALVPWVDTEAVSRQGTGGGGVLRVTIGAFLAGLTAAVLAVIGVGGIGLLAAKALAVGKLALILASIATLKHFHYKHDSGGQTVHYVPIHHDSHHGMFHDRSDYGPPYTDHRV